MNGLQPRWRLIASYAALFLVVFVPMSLSYVHTEREALMNRLNTNTESLARNLAEIVGEDLAIGQTDEVQRFVEATKRSDSDIAYLTIVGLDGFAYASSIPALRHEGLTRSAFESAALQVKDFTLRPTADPSVFEADMPVRFRSYEVGVLRLGMSTKVVNTLIGKSIQTILILASFSLLFAVLAYRLREKTAALVEANARLADLDRAKSEFLGIVSHELRTPLTSINGFLETILRRDEQVSEQRRRDYLKMMQHETNRLIRIVNDLLDITNIELGHYQLERGDTDLSAMAFSVADAVHVQNPRARIQIVGGDRPWIVNADGDKLRQVVINLVNNAVKYSPEGSPIVIELAGADGGVEVRVTDKGPGIAERHLEHLFEKFYRVPSDTGAEPGPKGSGLGLAISKKILQLHGGAIAVRSTVGEGSEFKFWLPADPAA